MTANKLVIPIVVPEREIKLTLYGESAGETIIEKTDAIENGEAPVQI